MEQRDRTLKKTYEIKSQRHQCIVTELMYTLQCIVNGYEFASLWAFTDSLWARWIRFGSFTKTQNLFIFIDANCTHSPSSLHLLIVIFHSSTYRVDVFIRISTCNFRFNFNTHTSLLLCTLDKIATINRSKSMTITTNFRCTLEYEPKISSLYCKMFQASLRFMGANATSVLKFNFTERNSSARIQSRNVAIHVIPQ